MALSRKDAKYSADLDSWVRIVALYLAEHSNPDAKARALQAVSDFCYGYSRDFAVDICSRIGIVDDLPHHLRIDVQGQAERFAQFLLARSSQSIFLLRDSYGIYDRVAQVRSDSVGALFNRDFICGGESNYFAVVRLIYESLEGADSYDVFRRRYTAQWRELVSSNPTLRKAAAAIGRYLVARSSQKPMLFIDCGLQFSLSLFCAAAVEEISTIPTDVVGFSAAPWLQELFADRFFSKRSDFVLSLEEEGRRDFARSLRERGSGALLGFAVGDALGFPAAGLAEDEAVEVFPEGIAGFEANPTHPFFSELEAGHYTSNTIMMLLAARWALRDEPEPAGLAQSMLMWWREAKARHVQDVRWLGPTTASALLRLEAGVNWSEAGSKTTDSCAGLYRSVPIAVRLRPFTSGDHDRDVAITKAVASISHRSAETFRGVQILKSVVGDALHGVHPRVALQGALRDFERDEFSRSLLLSKLTQAMELAEGGCSDASARMQLGTGSPIHQTLPLSLYFVLRYDQDIRAALLGAANSFRRDGLEESRRLGGLSREDQMVEAKGGNTDGIAALVGAILGAYRGSIAIPSDLANVENSEALLAIGAALGLKADTT